MENYRMQLDPVINILVYERLEHSDCASRETFRGMPKNQSGISLLLQAATGCLQGASLIYGKDAGKRLAFRLMDIVPDRTQGGRLRISDGRRWQPYDSSTLEEKHLPYGLDHDDPVRELNVSFDEGLPEAESRNLISNLDAYAVAVSDALLIVLDGIDPNEMPQRLVRMIAAGLISGRVVVAIRSNEEALLGTFDPTDATSRQLLAGDIHANSLLQEFFKPCSLGDIENELGRILNPLEVRTVEEPPAKTSRLYEYFSETQPGVGHFNIAGRIHASLTSLVLGGAGLLKAIRYNPDDSWFGMGTAEVLPAEQADQFDMCEPIGVRERFERSDRMANRFAGWYRDVTWLLYLLASLAVFAAVAGAIHLWTGEKSHFWAYVELVSIITIVVLVALSRRGGWHERWLFHRGLAEQLRYSRLAYPFMLSWFHGKIDGLVNFGVDLSEKDPIGWLVHRTFVATGLPASRTDQGRSNLVLPNQLLAAYARAVLDVQRKYHVRTAHQMHVVAHRLHLATTVMFVLTTLAVLLHFVLHEKWLLIFTAALPAFAAALHGIKVQLEFERLSATSHEMADTLQATLNAIDALASSQLDECGRWLRLRGLVLGACIKLASAADRWNDVVRHRKVDLPG